MMFRLAVPKTPSLADRLSGQCVDTDTLPSVGQLTEAMSVAKNSDLAAIHLWQLRLTDVPLLDAHVRSVLRGELAKHTQIHVGLSRRGPLFYAAAGHAFDADVTDFCVAAMKALMLAGDEQTSRLLRRSTGFKAAHQSLAAKLANKKRRNTPSTLEFLDRLGAAQATGALLFVLEAEERARSRRAWLGRAAWLFLVVAAGVGLGFLVSLRQSALLVLLFAQVIGPTIRDLARYPSPLAQSTTALLAARSDETRIVGPLLDALQHAPDGRRGALINTLIRLLSRLEVNDAPLLQQRLCDCRAARAWGRGRLARARAPNNWRGAPTTAPSATP